MRIRTRLTGLLLAIALAAASAPAARAADPLRLYVNGQELHLDSPPLIQEGRTLVPMRGYLESLGASVNWVPPATVTASMSGRSVQMEIGSTTALIDGNQFTLDVPAQLIQNRTYLPLRFLSEGLGAEVAYDGKSVTVNTQLPRLMVTDGPLNVRQAASTSAPILTTVPNGTLFDLIKQEGSWAQVALPRGATGWVATAFTRRLDAQPVVEPFKPFMERAEGFLQIGSRCLGATPVINDRLYLPLKPAVEQLGGSVTPEAGRITVRQGQRTLSLTSDSTAAELDGRPVTLTAAPVLIGGQVLMAARDLSALLELPLGWNEQLRTASLGSTTPEPVCNPQLPVKAYIIIDAATGMPLSEYHSRDPLPIASTTKVMTALLAVEKGSPGSVITVSRNAASQPGTSVYLRAGEQRTLRELLLGLMLVSGNDAATAIAEHLSGSEPAFVRLMNQRAKELGANSTLFITASGLDDFVNPYSTARDLAHISQQASRNPEFRFYMSQREATIPGPTGPRLLKNRNDFVLNYLGATGIKNGWTEKAGHTLVASAFRENRELIVVVLGAASRTALYQQAGQLMDHGFRLAGQSWLLQTNR